jgi:clan AA aspartic protease (TIGR02281 family)
MAALGSALLGLAPPAHATLNCYNFVQNEGDAGHNPPVSATVGYDNNGAWQVIYTLRDGRVIDRSAQYNMTRDPDASKTHWSGTFYKNPAVVMDGAVMVRNADDHLVYIEAVFKNGKRLGVNTIDCGPEARGEAPQVAPAPTPAPATPSAHVPFIYVNGEMRVPVSLGGYPVNMVIDTGATSMTVNDALAAQLVANGQASWTGATVQITIADGTKQTRREISINTLTVGDRTIHNVLGHVSPDGADMLLGNTVLARLGAKFGINIAKSTLDFD